LRRSLKTGVTETKPYLDYAQTPKTLCLTFKQNTRSDDSDLRAAP